MLCHRVCRCALSFSFTPGYHLQLAVSGCVYFIDQAILCEFCLYVPCGHLLGRADPWLSFVVSNCEFVTFPLVSWVRCGT